IVINSRDITERKRAEEALAANEKRFRALIENSNDAIALVSADGTNLYASPSVNRVLGYSFEELEGRSAFEWIHPDDLRHAANLFAQLLEKPGAHATGQFRYQQKDGAWRWYEAIATNLLAEPSVQAIVANYRDITARKQAEQMLKETQEKIQKIFDSSPDAISLMDLNGIIIECNQTAVNMLGYSTKEELLGTSAFNFVVESERQRAMELLQEVLARGTMHGVEFTMLRRDGSQFAAETAGSVLRDPAGKPTGLVVITTDITERKRAEEALRESEKRYRNLIETAPIGIVVTVAGKVIFCNRKESELFGLASPLETQGRPISEFVHKDDLPKLVRFAQSIRRGEVPEQPVSFRGIRADGKEIVVEGFALRGQFGAEDSLLSFHQDITARRRAEEEREELFQEVLRAREQLQALSRRLVEVQETERRLIARELHDEVGQVLTGLSILLETSSHLPADTLRSRLSNAQSLVEQLMGQVQGLSLDLRPTMLDDLGLLPALLWFTKRFADQTGVRVHLEHTGLDRRFAPEIETAAYRITQEALTNIARHAGVKEATARLWATLDTLHVQIEDRGQGFDVQAALAAPTSSGLSGMRERAVALGGNLTIESTPGVGTYVTLQAPLSGSLERRTKERRE
ncbi:MAG: PAS domain S-box protein, partial [Chloroflexota bacterium]|nr:PAS domain S-box protein [Chloroflexota bacterium]